MKFPFFFPASALALLIGLLASSPGAFAQEEPAAADPSFQILKLTPQFVPSPDSTIPEMRKKMSRRKTKWLEVEANFAWAPQKPEERADPYLDNLSVQFYVLLPTASKKHPMVLLKGETPLRDVAAGDQLNAAMYVSPRALDRLFAERVPSTAAGAAENVAVQIKRDGKVVCTQVLKGKQEFWKDPRLSQLTLDGYLLKKSETPFASHAWEYFEQERNSP